MRFSPTPRKERNPFHLLTLETLEGRSVPAILFHEGTTATVTDGGGRVLDRVDVELVYWGAGWSGNPSLQGSMTSAVESILAGPYISSLAQYRSSIGSGSHVGTVAITSSSPPGVFQNADVSNMLQANINNGSLPSPADDGQLLYMVIPQPGSSAGNLGGYHTYAYSTRGLFHYGWTINDGTLDTLTRFFSHELAESVTDPEGTAVQVNPPDAQNWDEICDNEAQNYTYRLNNVLVQSYLSVRDHAYVVPTGQAQDFLVSSSRVLTVNGDQSATPDDTIVLDQTGTSGVLATLNGETAQFDPGAVGGIVVADGAGTDTIDILKTVFGQPVTINLGPDVDTVNITPTVRNLDSLQGNVTINGGTGIGTVTVNDQAAAASQTYSITSGVLSRPGSALVVFSELQHIVLNGGSGTNTYDVMDTEAGSATTIDAGNGSDGVNVQATEGPLTVNLGTAANTVTVSASGNDLSSLQGNVTINGGTGANTLTLNDQANSASQAFTLTASSVRRSGAAGVFFNSRIDQLIVNGGSGANTYSVRNTGAISRTTLNTGSGADSVTVEATSSPLTVTGNGGNGQDTVALTNAGSVQDIRGDVTVENPPSLTTLTVDDSGDPGDTVLTQDHAPAPDDQTFGQITGLAPATIRYKYSDIRTVNLTTGSGAVTVTVASTYDQVMLYANSASDTTLVGSDSANNWTLTDQGVGTLDGPALYGRVNFYGVDDLVGGADDDTFVFQNGGGVAGTIDGGDGVNTLDYSLCSNAVVVDLQTGAASGLGGAVVNIQNVVGGHGAYNILVGDGGNVLVGGAGTRNVLIAGPSAGILLGGGAQDILIGGTTAYDADPDSLLAVMAEWGRADEDYWDRVANVTAGNGSPLLDATTVTSNGGGNVLIGGPGPSLYYGNLAADHSDWDATTEAFVSV